MIITLTHTIAHNIFPHITGKILGLDINHSCRYCDTEALTIVTSQYKLKSMYLVTIDIVLKRQIYYFQLKVQSTPVDIEFLQ